MTEKHRWPPNSVTRLTPLGVNLPLAPSSELSCLLVEEGFTPVREHEVESIFAVGNGYIGTRASLEVGGRFSQPVTFAAGIYADDPASELGPALVPLPLAAGVLAPWGILLTPAEGAVLMSASTVMMAVHAQLLKRVKL